MPESLNLTLVDTAATEAFGRRLGSLLIDRPAAGLNLWLEGELGAGKTTLVRACLRGLGHTGRVPSPTYTLVEPYEIAGGMLHHVDLYRLGAPDEAEELGINELPARGGLLLVEWPARGQGHLPAADLRLCLAVAGQGRRLALVSGSPAGAALLSALA